MKYDELNELAEGWSERQPDEPARKVAKAMLKRVDPDLVAAGSELSHELSLEYVAQESRRYHEGKDVVSERTIQRTLPRFEATGAITIEHNRHRDDGRQLPNRYVFNLDRVARQADYEEWLASLDEYGEAPPYDPPEPLAFAGYSIPLLPDESAADAFERASAEWNLLWTAQGTYTGHDPGGFAAMLTEDGRAAFLERINEARRVQEDPDDPWSDGFWER